MNVLIEVSARHVHLTKEDFHLLFGEDKELTFKKALSQPGQFLSNERVEIIGPKGKIGNVAILGPYRSKTQIEVTLTDCRALGVEAPIRESGKLENSAPVSIAGPLVTIHKDEGLIAAKRHIHMHTSDALQFGFQDGQIVSVEVPGKRPVCLHDTVIRAGDQYALAMHIDIDEANAAGFPLNNEDVFGTVIAGNNE